jgi:mortality factor 4-like protein 1
MLLYKKERDQYTEEVKGDVSPSTVYGAEHLLRLFGMSNFQLHEIVLYFWFIL